jgi:hypothetical protein
MFNPTFHQSPAPHREPHSSAVVRRQAGEGLLTAVEMHRRRTGWRGPVIIVRA